MSSIQTGILAPVPSLGRYLEFNLVPDREPTEILRDLSQSTIDDRVVIGLGASLAMALDRSVEGLRPFPSVSGAGLHVPSTQAACWLWLRGSDRGEIIHCSRRLSRLLHPAFRCERIVDGFKYGAGLDLTGYRDGTENPEGDAAMAAAVVRGAGSGLDGSSFVAVQQWVHDLDHFEGLSQDERDDVIGRRLADNVEFDEAPSSAHVKRTAQESFTPEAFVVRRSMPWADPCAEGLMFVAFGKSLDAFEAQLRRMTGGEDRIVDGLFRFTRPISGSYFWCPPVANGRLDLSAMGL